MTTVTRPSGALSATALARLRAALRDGRARALRERAEVSQVELARSAGVSRSALCAWEAGRRTPRGAPALRYLSALDALALVLDEETP